MEELVTDSDEIVSVLLIGIGLLFFMTLAIILFFYFSRRRIIKTELEKANLEIEHQRELLQSTLITQEEERKRIAQDLHDAISSKLNVVSLHANFLTEPGISPEDTQKFGANIQNVTATVLENSRRIAHDLLPPTLEKFGLAPALEELCDEVSESGTFKVAYQFDYPVATMPPEQELHLFRIAQELFNNSIKYSEASHIELELSTVEKVLTFMYSDNGKGFDTEDAKMAKGLGMSGIHNRASILEGQLEIHSELGHGMRLMLQKSL